MICLNGHSVTAPESSTGFILTKQTRLYISDCTDQPGTIYPSACEAGAFQLNADMGMLVLENVTVDGTDVYTESQNIGAIHINKCTGMVRLDGATIKGCTAVNGPAIYAEGRPNTPAVVTIANGSRITGNKVTASSEGSAAVLGKHASITVSDSTLTDNESEAICGVALSFASAGSLTLHNAVITGNRSLYSDMTNLQVGALYIHNGNRNLTISGDTVIEGNTRIDGEPADIYLQRTVREVNPDRWPHPFHLQLGTLTENASINICPGLGYEQEMLKEDITNLPLLAFVPEADTEQWQPQWLRIDQWDMLLAYNPVESKFDLVRNTSNRQAAR